MTSVHVQTRPKPAPAPRPAPRRPPLRALPDNYVPPRIRRRRARLFGAGVGLLIGLGLFGIAALHVVLTQGQFKLEQLQRQANEQQARYEQLRLQAAELESPERIVAVAQERLGMVPPRNVTYLAPRGPAATAAAASDSRDNAEPTASWTEVKPHLDTAP